MKGNLLVSSAIAATVAAQQSLYGQCGGIGWTGATNCVAGAACTSYNAYYFQCIPGATTATTKATTTPVTTTKVATTTPKTTTKATTTKSTTKATTTPSTTTKVTTKATTKTTANGSCPTTFVSTSGKEFRLAGQKFYYAGSNAYFIPMYGPNDTGDMDAALDAFKSSGLKVLRTWGFADFVGPQESYVTVFQNWTTVPPTILTTQEWGLPRLDYVVAGAEARGIKLIIPFVNNWADYGGMDLYVKQVVGSSGTHDMFYTNSQIKTIYKNYIAAVIARYKNSPAIMAWELANEIRCAGTNLGSSSSCNAAVLTSWASEISAYIKSLDPCHLVSVGDEGFFNIAGNSDYVYNGGAGVDNEALTALSTIDFGTFHMYPNSWGETYDWGNKWITDHAAIADKHNKPMVLEEYGVPRSSGVRDQYMAQYHATVLNSSIAGDMFWQFGTTVPNWGQSYDDGYSIFPADADWNTLVPGWAAQMAAKN
ncbi:hypothetical protein AA313_de0206007 [Arthrobotrys entomopaga]|nr:hypothetical protein AA313_de0206007 [Arthrobotrys entomopaga]